MDIPAFFRKLALDDADSDSESVAVDRGSFKVASSKRPLSSSRGGGTAHSSRRRNKFLALIDGGMSEEMSESNARDELHYHATAHSGGSGNHLVDPAARELKLPTGPVLYNPNVWISDEMRAIRARFSDGIFFQQFNSGLQAFYAKDWVSYFAGPWPRTDGVLTFFLVAGNKSCQF